MKTTKIFSLQLITSFSLLLMSTGCIPKNTDGTYNSAYSYHPYNDYKAKNAYNKTQKKQNYKQKTYRQTRYNSNHYGNPNESPRKYNPKLLPDRIEKKAKSMLGMGYRLGANGPREYDCSSFTKHVFSSQGIRLPRVSKEQAKVGKYLRLSQLKKGDLVFFSSKRNTGVSHVGIFLGQGKFIHASSGKTKAVTISKINTDYYTTHFKWGRRITNAGRYARR